jgi:hypothetical protein
MGGYLALVMWITGGWIVSGNVFALIFGRVCQRMMPWE